MGTDGMIYRDTWYFRIRAFLRSPNAFGSAGMMRLLLNLRRNGFLRRTRIGRYSRDRLGQQAVMPMSTSLMPNLM